jgi:hypothetical protein
MVNEGTNSTALTNTTMVVGLLTEILVDSYPESFMSSVLGVAVPGPYAVGQSFIAKQAILKNATFFLRKDGLPEGTFRAYLYAHAGDFGESSVPTGVPLAVSKTEIKIEDLPTVNTLHKFEFTDNFRMKEGVPYVIVLGGVHTVADLFSTIRIGIDSVTRTHAGNRSFSQGGAWSVTNTELIFYVNGLEYPVNASTQPTSLTNI